MNIEIPPIPTIYSMVNLEGFDLATANGIRVPGIYDKVYDAMSEDKIEIFYNWKFADVILPPSYVEIDDSIAGVIVVNDEIMITSGDSVSIIGISRPPVINSLLVTENGTYTVETGVDGFSPVVVQVPGPVLGTLNVTQNGTYTPSTEQDGFSEVVVDVPDPPPPVLVSLNATENGEYLPGVGEDGFSQVEVAVPVPSPYDNIPEMDGVGSSGDSVEWARGNHRHPTDTSRAAASDIRFTMYTDISQLGFETKPTMLQLVNAMSSNSIFIGKGDDSISDVPAVSWGALFVVKTVTNRWFAKWISQNVANNQYYEYGRSGANNRVTDWKTIYSGV